MAFDINKIIAESIQENIDNGSTKKQDVITESEEGEKGMKEKAAEVGKKALEKAEEMDAEHPWGKYAAASAIAAGLGGLALRKRLAKLKKK